IGFSHRAILAATVELIALSVRSIRLRHSIRCARTRNHRKCRVERARRQDVRLERMVSAYRISIAMRPFRQLGQLRMSRCTWGGVPLPQPILFLTESFEVALHPIQPVHAVLKLFGQPSLNVLARKWSTSSGCSMSRPEPVR